jgi:hypothetical protein
LLLVAGALSAGCATQGATPPPERRSSASPEIAFSSMLTGTWQGVTPGNELRIDIDNVLLRSLQHSHDLFIRVAGRYERTNVNQSGYMHVQNQGNDVFVGFIPHFDPTVTSLSPRAGRFTASEANAACSFYVAPRGDGFHGETRGGSCALAMRGAVGKWEIELEPGTLAVRHVESGETLRFRKVSR